MRFTRDGEKGRGYVGGGRGRLLYLSLHCHHQNDSRIKMGSDESHFNVSLIVRDKVSRQCPQTTILEVKGEPKQIPTEVPLLTMERASWTRHVTSPNDVIALCSLPVCAEVLRGTALHVIHVLNW